jgi:hypothetical protein
MSSENGNGRLDAFTIVERAQNANQDAEGSDKKYWVKIGSAFVNKDDSLNVYLDAVPINGMLHLRKPTSKQKS